MNFLGGMTQGSGGQSSNTNTTSNSTTSIDYPSYLDTLAQNIGTQANGLINAPFPTYDVNNVFAPFQPTQTQAFNQVGANQNTWQPYFNNATGALNNGSTASTGYFNQAGANQTPTQAASPYFSQAAQTWNSPGVASSYMNPYISGSVNAANQLASQNFTQNVMPSLTQQFVAGGGGGDGSRGSLGSPQYTNAANWALTNFNNSVNNADQTALANGYFNSANQFQTDQSRLAGLGQASATNAATGTGLLTNLGTASNNAGATNAGIFGQLGNNFSNNNLTNTNALLQVGNQQQQQAQNPLSFNYQQFLNQQNWPYQLLSWGTGIESGLKTPMTSTTNSTSNSSTNGSANSSPSGLGSLFGGLSAFQSLGGANGISNLFGLGGGGQAGGFSALSPSDTMNAYASAPSSFTMPGFKRGGRPDKAQGYFADGGRIASDGVPEFGLGGFFGSLLGGMFGNKQLGSDIGTGADLALQLLPLLNKGGHFSSREPERYATGGLAVVTRAGRKQTRNYIDGQERQQRNLQRAEQAASKPLATKGNGFFGGRDRAPRPAAALPMTRSPGFFAHV